MPAFLPSELPVRASARHHWIVLFRLPHRCIGVALRVLLLVVVLLEPTRWRWFFVARRCRGISVPALADVWRAEWIILTSKRIIRVQGVPETTSSEASLRLDRISGVALIETVLGQAARLRRRSSSRRPATTRACGSLVKIADRGEFYLELRRRGLRARPSRPRPGRRPAATYITEPLPAAARADATGSAARPDF